MLIDISPLRISRDYRLLFLGQLVSAFGTAMTFVVVPVQVYQLTGSTLLVGLLSASEFVLILLMALVGGAYADFIDKRKMLRLTEIGQTLVTVVLVAVVAGEVVLRVALVGAVALDRGGPFKPETDPPRWAVGTQAPGHNRRSAKTTTQA